MRTPGAYIPACSQFPTTPTHISYRSNTGRKRKRNDTEKGGDERDKHRTSQTHRLHNINNLVTIINLQETLINELVSNSAQTKVVVHY